MHHTKSYQNANILRMFSWNTQVQHRRTAPASQARKKCPCIFSQCQFSGSKIKPIFHRYKRGFSLWPVAHHWSFWLLLTNCQTFRLLTSYILEKIGILEGFGRSRQKKLNSISVSLCHISEIQNYLFLSKISWN